MKIKDLEYFQQLIKDQNFSRVAQHFGVSQPTITMAIQRLEHEFNTSFFVRDHVHRELRVTTTGQQFANHVDLILNELQVAHQEIDRANSTKVRFGLPPIIGNYYFPPLTPRLMRHQLMGSLETYEHGSRGLLKMLQHGELDMALLGSLTPLKEAQLKAQELARFPFQVVVGAAHPLAGQATVDFAALKNEQFIIPDTEFFHDQAFKQMCRRAHFRPRILYRTVDIHVIKAMVSENLGITFLTSLAIEPGDKVKQVEIQGPDLPIFHLSVAMRETEELTPRKQELWDLLTNHHN